MQRSLPAIICDLSSNEPGRVLRLCIHKGVLLLWRPNDMVPQLLIHVCICLSPQLCVLAWWFIAVVEKALHKVKLSCCASHG